MSLAGSLSVHTPTQVPRPHKPTHTLLSLSHTIITRDSGVHQTDAHPYNHTHNKRMHARTHTHAVTHKHTHTHTHTQCRAAPISTPPSALPASFVTPPSSVEAALTPTVGLGCAARQGVTRGGAQTNAFPAGTWTRPSRAQGRVAIETRAVHRSSTVRID